MGLHYHCRLTFPYFPFWKVTYYLAHKNILERFYEKLTLIILFILFQGITQKLESHFIM